MDNEINAMIVAEKVWEHLPEHMVFRLEGPFQNEYQDMNHVHQAVLWLANDCAVSIVTGDYTIPGDELLSEVSLFRMISDSETWQISPFGMGWETIPFPGDRDDSPRCACDFGEVLDLVISAVSIRFPE